MGRFHCPRCLQVRPVDDEHPVDSQGRCSKCADYLKSLKGTL